MDIFELKFRPYEDSDKQRLLEIYDAVVPQSHYFLSKDTLLKERQICEEFLDRSNIKTIVLEANSEIVGFSTLASEIKMAGFFIDEQFQGKSLGRKLIEYIQKDMHTIELAVYERNRKALRFYKNNGFERIDQFRETPNSPKYLVMKWEAKNN